MNRFVALDFETGGTDPQRHAPISLGLAIFENGEVTEHREWVIGPTLHWKTGKIERAYEIAALEISGIKWGAIKSAPLPKAIVADVTAWADVFNAANLPIVAFNAAFDLAFYSTLLFLASDWHPTEKGVKVQPVPPLVGPWHCAMMLARAELTLPDYKLDTVADQFGFARETNVHGALEDAILAGRVYSALTADSVKEGAA